MLWWRARVIYCFPRLFTVYLFTWKQFYWKFLVPLKPQCTPVFSNFIVITFALRDIETITVNTKTQKTWLIQKKRCSSNFGVIVLEYILEWCWSTHLSWPPCPARRTWWRSGPRCRPACSPRAWAARARAPWAAPSWGRAAPLYSGTRQR